ncbi:MAG: FAD:protein FMN transferase [Gemmatimonadota bacterium]
MGVAVRLVIAGAGRPVAERGARAAYAAIADLEQRLSDWRPSSEVRRLAERPREWIPVSAPLFAVLERARAIARASEGAFDPTAGPLIALWRQARSDGVLPTPAALARAKARSGWTLLRLRPATRAVWLQRDSMRLDLGGIAKGFILDSARRLLAAQGLTRTLLEAGGDIVLGDAPPGQSGWKVSVRTSNRDTILSLRRVAVGTSGAEAQHLDLGGVRYSHVIDPRTGWALTAATEVTVVHPLGALADALATMASVRPRDGPQLARRLGATMVLIHDEPGP